MHSFKAGALAPIFLISVASALARGGAASAPGRERRMTSRMPIMLFARDREAARAAVRRFTRRLQADADDADAWHALGDALIRLGDRPAACTAFRNAVQLDARRAHSQRALGNLLFDSGQLDHALRCFASVEGR